MKNNIRFDFITNTITVSKGFYEEACKYGTDENAELKRVMEDYPNMRVAVRSVRSGSRQQESKGLTYKYMRKFIAIMDRNNLSVFEQTILYYETLCEENSQVYQCVKGWFLENYPRHREMIVEAEPQRRTQAEIEAAA